MKIITAFALALTLLTRIPIPSRLFKGHNLNALKPLSAIFYPLIGGLIGIILALCCKGLSAAFSANITSVLMLIIWVGITGALHLDGLADATDAYFGSHKTPEKTLAIFRDPNCGSMAVVAVVICLLIKYVFMAELLEQSSGLTARCLIVIPIIARLIVLPYLYFTPYARSNGLAENLNVSIYKNWLISLSLGLLAILCTLLPIKLVLLLISSNLLLLLWWRKIWLTRINGYTGDCLGAIIELSEVLSLSVLLCALTVLNVGQL